MDSPASDMSEMTVLRALESTVRVPSGRISSTSSDTDASEFDDYRKILLQEVRNATEEYEVITGERDLHDDTADPVRAIKLHRLFYEANNRLLHAERDYCACEAQMKQYPEQREQSGAEAKTRESPNVQREADQPQQVEDCKTYTEEIQTLKHQAQLDSETIAGLRNQLQVTKLNTARSTLAQRRENTELTGFNNFLSWEAAQLTSRIREVECLNEQLQYHEELLDMDRFDFNPNWVDPKPKDVEGAIAARALAKTLAFHFGGGELLIAVDDEPMKSVKDEVDRVRRLLGKHGVLPNVFESEHSENGEPDSPRLL